MFEIVDGWMPDDGYPISSPGSGKLISRRLSFKSSSICNVNVYAV